MKKKESSMAREGGENREERETNHKRLKENKSRVNGGRWVGVAEMGDGYQGGHLL